MLSTIRHNLFIGFVSIAIMAPAFVVAAFVGSLWLNAVSMDSVASIVGIVFILSAFVNCFTVFCVINFLKSRVKFVREVF